MASSFDGFWVLVVLKSTSQLKQHRGSIVIAGGLVTESRLMFQLVKKEITVIESIFGR